MRISELSTTSGVPIPTIKYYLREGLLPAGTRSAANQAYYGDDHVRRLLLIRALAEIGGLPLAAVGAVLAAVDDPAMAMHDVLGVAHHGLAMRGAEADASDLSAPMSEIETFVEHLGWTVKPDAPGKRELARTLSALRRLGWNVTAEVFAPYADAADRIAAWELARTPHGAPRSQIVERAVVGTVVFESALLALRRLAEEHHSSLTFPVADGPPGG